MSIHKWEFNMNRSWWIITAVAFLAFFTAKAYGIGIWLSALSAAGTVFIFIILFPICYFLVQDLKRAPIESIVLIVLLSLNLVLDVAILVKVW